GELARAARYKAEFFRPRFTRLLVDALNGSERIRDVMADLVAGTQSYRGLKWRLAKTAGFGLAWKLLGARRWRPPGLGEPKPGGRSLAPIQGATYPSRARTRTFGRFTRRWIERHPGLPPTAGAYPIKY